MYSNYYPISSHTFRAVILAIDLVKKDFKMVYITTGTLRSLHQSATGDKLTIGIMSQHSNKFYGRCSLFLKNNYNNFPHCVKKVCGLKHLHNPL